MNKKATHAANQETQTQATHAQDAQASATTAAADATPVVSAATATPSRDEHTGKGGLYSRKNGVRQLKQRTEPEKA